MDTFDSFRCVSPLGQWKTLRLLMYTFEFELITVNRSRPKCVQVGEIGHDLVIDRNESFNVTMMKYFAAKGERHWLKLEKTRNKRQF